MNRFPRFFGVVLTAITVTHFCPAAAAAAPEASSLQVTTTSDTSTATDGLTSLREAIANANARAGDDTITFAPGVTGAIDLTAVLPDLSGNVVIQGPGANLLAVRRGTGGSYRIVTVLSGQTVSISGLTISNGQAESGGGIYNAGDLTLNSCTISGNSASAAAGGGGIYNFKDAGQAAPRPNGSLFINNCTISGNTAAQNGGGIYNCDGVLAIRNSTISANTASAPAGGGGIYNVKHFFANTHYEGGKVSIIAATISGNSNGGIYNDGTLSIGSSILQSSAGGAIVNDPGHTNANDDPGITTSTGYNLSNDAAGGSLNATGDEPNTDPLLDPAGLKNNGGPTLTIALRSNSPALDAGDDAVLAPGGANLQTDQRGVGYPRKQGGHVDIGAFELPSANTQAPAIAITTPSHASRILSLTSVAGAATDNAGGGGIKRVTVLLSRSVNGASQYWDGKIWTSTATYLIPTLSSPNANTTNWSLPAAQLPSGNDLPLGIYYLRAWAYDGANHVAFSGLKSFTMTDAAALAIAITTPADGSKVSALTIVAGVASDNTAGSGVKNVTAILSRIVGGASQYWTGSTWTNTASYLTITLSNPNAANTDWSVPVAQLPSGNNLPPGVYYLRAWAYNKVNVAVFSGLKSFTVIPAAAPTAPAL